MLRIGGHLRLRHTYVHFSCNTDAKKARALAPPLEGTKKDP